MENLNVIATDAALREFTARAESAAYLAIDTEFVRERTYFPVLCLIQVATDSELALIDPLALSDLEPLWTLFGNPLIPKILHAASQDLEVLLQAGCPMPVPLIDTQVAAALCGHGDQIGYANLVQIILGIELDKSMTRTDWSRRPLPKDALHYAADDVRYLYVVFEKLLADLESHQRGEWLAPEMESLTDPQRYAVQPENAWKKIRGVKKLRPVQVTRLKAMAAWREQTAVDLNLPRQWIVRDEVMLFLAQRPVKSLQELGDTRGIDEKFLQRHGNALLKALADSESAEPPADIPKDARRLSVNQDAQVDFLMAALKILAADASLSAASIATRKDLEKLVRGDLDIELLQGWRRAAAGQQLLELLAGKAALRANGDTLDFE